MESQLKKALTPFKLWAIVVGMVISGMYCGWNNALSSTSPVGFIVATLIVTVFYTVFMFSYAELATAMPKADGASGYALKAIGRFGGFFAGFSAMVEFLFATPAIAISIGAYINFIFPAIPSIIAALAAYAIFVIINCIGVETAATIETVVTVIAIIGLVLFVGFTFIHINPSKIVGGNMSKGGIGGIFNAVPFAIWFYLAAEGGAMSAEECKNPKKDIPRGFILAILTLVVMALGTFVCTAGVLDIKTLAATNSPIPDTLKVIFGKDSILPKVISFIGLFGLIASLHGIIIGYSRQVFAMSRSGYFPKVLCKLNSKGAPVPAIIVPSLIGMLFVLSNNTAVIIVISAFGAIALQVISMISFFILRKKAPTMERPYKAPVYLAAVALVIDAVFLVTVTYANLSTIGWVIGAFVVAIVYYAVYSKFIDSQVQVKIEEEKAV